MKLSDQGALLIAFVNLAACHASSSEELSLLALDSDSQATEKLLSMIPERHTLDSIEDTVLKLANRKGKTAQAPAQGSSLDPFVQSILNITENTLKQNIIQRCNNTQARLDNLSIGNHSCDSIYPGNSSIFTDLYEYNKTHIECRLREAAKYREIALECTQVQNKYDQDLLAAKMKCDACQNKKVYPDFRETCKMGSLEPAPTIGNYLNTMTDTFKTLYDDLVNTCSLCDPTKTSTTSTTTSTAFQPPCFPFGSTAEAMRKARCEYEDLNLQCDKFQAQFEEKACEYGSKYTCSKYNTCFDNFEASFNATTISEAKEQEQAYELEWRAVLRIECLLRALNASDLDAAIDTCKAANRTEEADAAIVLNYPALPPARKSCTIADTWLQPGNANFGWYGILPNDVSALSCAASCCGSPNFQASYPDGVKQICPYESCPWLSPHAISAGGVQGMLLCQDFTFASNCAGRGGRRKCPPNSPNMCAGATCDDATDHCCSSTTAGCDQLGGLRSCAAASSNSTLVTVL